MHGLPIYFQWSKFHELPKYKFLDAFPFYLEGHAKIWYDALSINYIKRSIKRTGEFS